MNTKSYLLKLYGFKQYLQDNCLGEGLAKTSTELSMWGCPRDIRKMVSKLRLLGNPVCSGNTGYYMPKCSAELWSTINRIKCMAKEDMNIVYALTNNSVQGD